MTFSLMKSSDRTKQDASNIGIKCYSKFKKGVFVNPIKNSSISLNYNKPIIIPIKNDISEANKTTYQLMNQN